MVDCGDFNQGLRSDWLMAADFIKPIGPDKLNSELCHILRRCCFQRLFLVSTFPSINKTAILSWRRIRLAILLYGQFIHLTQITLRPLIQLSSTQQHAYQSLFSYFLVLFRLQYSGILGEF